VHSSAPAGRWNSTTIIGAIRMDGSTACMTVEGATDAEVFRSYISQVLCPVLRADDIVVMDNLSVHKNDQALSLIRQTGAQVLFLPAYSPDLNPIEKMWSKVKNTLRSLEARSQEALLAAIGKALEGVTLQDSMNWFAHCGYNFI
jgi:transposase